MTTEHSEGRDTAPKDLCTKYFFFFFFLSFMPNLHIQMINETVVHISSIVCVRVFDRLRVCKVLWRSSNTHARAQTQTHCGENSCREKVERGGGGLSHLSPSRENTHACVPTHTHTHPPTYSLTHTGMRSVISKCLCLSPQLSNPNWNPDGSSEALCL